MDDVIDNLVSFGLSQLEASIYLFFLQEGPATGYRAAQALGKPAANTYKAIESLENKGWLLADESSSRLLRPVPAEELLRRLDRDFHERSRQATQQLKQIERTQDDERVYRLRSRKHVLERFRTMLGACRQTALVDIFPLPLAEVRQDLEAAAVRGVHVGVQVYEPVEVAGAEVALAFDNAGAVARWPGMWLNIVVDGQELMLAYFTGDGRSIHQATWTQSPYLSWIYHSGAAAALMLSRQNELARRGVTADVMQAEYKRLYDFCTPDAAGYKALMNRYGSSENGKPKMEKG